MEYELIIWLFISQITNFKRAFIVNSIKCKLAYTLYDAIQRQTYLLRTFHA